MTFKRWWKESWDEVVIYLGTLASVLVSPYLASAANGTDVHLEATRGYLLIGAIVSVALVAFFESRGFDPEDTPKEIKAKRDAKKRNVGGRLSLCMGLGFTWPNVIAFIGGLVSGMV